MEELNKTQTELIKLEKKNSVIAMAVTANHEINQPLMCIRGNLDLLSLHIEKRQLLDSETEKYLTKLNEAVTKISQILTKFKKNTNIHFGEYSEETPMVVYKENEKS